MADRTQKQIASAALWRAIRSLVAMALPIGVSMLASHPDVRWAALAPVIMALGKYCRDAFGMDWIPV